MDLGRFISFEGGEGAGKSTQAKLLAADLRSRGITVHETREPGGTSGAEAIRNILLSIEGDGWHPRAEALLFAAARSDHVERMIKPALFAGEWVICDRFVDSSRAYQGGGGSLSDDDITMLHQFGSTGLLPDITVLINVSPEVASQRLALRDTAGSDRIGGRDAAYHAKVARAFDVLADKEPERFVRITGNGTAEQTQALVMSALAPLFSML